MYLSSATRTAYASCWQMVSWILSKQYGLNYLLEQCITSMFLGVGWLFYRVGDSLMLNGIAERFVGGGLLALSQRMRKTQTGYLTDYVWMMLAAGVVLLLCVLLSVRGVFYA